MSAYIINNNLCYNKNVLFGYIHLTDIHAFFNCLMPQTNIILLQCHMFEVYILLILCTLYFATFCYDLHHKLQKLEIGSTVDHIQCN